VIAAVDISPAMRPVASGTEVYAREVSIALAAQAGDRTLRLYANAAAPPPWLPVSAQWRGIPFPRLWTHWRFAQALRTERPDVVYVPSHVLPVVSPAPGVVTIHDLGHRSERASYSRSAWLYLELTTRLMAQRAARLIAVSQTTARDLQRIYGVDPERIAVIYSGVNERMQPQSPAAVRALRVRYALPERYFLYVGRSHPRKNLPLLRRAFGGAQARGLNALLVLAGPGHAAETADGVRILSYVPQGELPALYSGAIALTQPSRFEGFGFPVLEAMRCGTPVIAAAAGALPEIVADAGLLVDPNDSAAWTEALLRMSEDRQLRERMIHAGFTRSAGFTWTTTATKIWGVLDEAAAS
jgi:glycosyltransferase involved in cell wall biosynthesis